MKKKIILKKSKKSKPISENTSKPLTPSLKPLIAEAPKNEGVSISNADAADATRTISVDSIIGQSQNTITQSSIKRGRGRPRKIETTNPPNGSGMSGNIGSISTTGNMPATTKPVSIPKTVLKPVIELPFKYASVQTGFDGWELSSEESDAVSEQLDAVIQQYLPATSSPHAPLYILCGTLTVMSVLRYMQYLDFKKERVKNGQNHKEPSL